VLLATAGGTLFAFGGAPRWTTIPLATGVVLLLALTRPRIAATGTRLLDSSLIAVLAAILLQLIPVPSPLRAAISPGSVRFDRVALMPPRSPFPLQRRRTRCWHSR
jgi:hypothetical protein